MTHRVAVLCQGDPVEVCNKDDALKRLQHAYIRRLMAAVPTLQLKQRRLDASALVVLRVTGLDKTCQDKRGFGPQRMVHAAPAVSVEIRRSQTWGIVGASGSGKRTVAGCVVRLVDPSGGAMLLGGDRTGEADEDIAMAR